MFVLKSTASTVDLSYSLSVDKGAFNVANVTVALGLVLLTLGCDTGLYELALDCGTDLYGWYSCLRFACCPLLTS